MEGSIEGPRQVLDPMRVDLRLPRVPWFHFCCIECKNIANKANFLCGESLIRPPPPAWLRILKRRPGEHFKGVFQEYFKGFWSYLQKSFKSVSNQCLVSFRMVLRKFQVYLRYFQECFIEASRKCYENFKGVSSFRCVSGKFQGCFKSVSQAIQEALEASFKGDYKRVSRMFQGLFIVLSSVFQECFKEV